mmetsp:Transcript_27302/g.49084  ORF Transcript_27302/g.49084 Transcript_27302/m.49084 type:complete len:620 (+) Transcript_27302:1915-3774(+)
MAAVSKMRKSTPKSQVSGTTATEQEAGESVRVCLRLRPLNERERASGSGSCVSVLNPQQLQLDLKGQMKNFRYHQVMDETYTQGRVFSESGVHLLLDSILQGYAASVFAYGQTGSGKTYTMAGIEDLLGRPDYTSDETDGIIPRGISYLWQEMSRKEEQFFVKAAFMEIYNEQVRDLLNPAAGILHCRWNVKTGFFVEDLLVVDCTSIDDLIAVLHEGIRNRKTGSHELNKDSSRSHSILIVYVISEIRSEDGHSFKKYGKINFVDLAGSERLKETKSAGEMVTETKNINKSLFTLGKVISALGDRRKTKTHIPYRDSKLTMLLMDSLGGNSKALMMACVSPAAIYVDETASTLAYAARTMNIKNRPIVQIDGKEQVLFNLKREIQLLRLEKEYLIDQLYKVTGGLPIEIGSRTGSSKSGSGKLPPLPKAPQVSNAGAKMIEEYQNDINRLKEENAQLLNSKEVLGKLSSSVVQENVSLASKLNHLESVFTDLSTASSSDRVSEDYTITTVTLTQLLNENSSLKRQLARLEQEKQNRQARPSAPSRTSTTSDSEAFNLKQHNNQLQKRIEFLQRREKELLEHLIRTQKAEGKTGTRPEEAAKKSADAEPKAEESKAESQ